MKNVVKQHDAFIGVTVAGRDLFGYWDEFSPPEAGSETGRYREGGTTHATATRGLPNRGTGTVTKTLQFPNLADLKWLERQAGRGDITVTEQPKDADGNPFGDARIYTGILQQVSPSDYNADGNDNRTVQITFQSDDEIG